MVCAIFQKALALWCAPCVRFLGEEYPQRPAALPSSLKDAAKLLRFQFIIFFCVHFFFIFSRNLLIINEKGGNNTSFCATESTSVASHASFSDFPLPPFMVIHYLRFKIFQKTENENAWGGVFVESADRSEIFSEKSYWKMVKMTYWTHLLRCNEGIINEIV